MEHTNSSVTTNRFHSKNKTSYTKSSSTTQQLQPQHAVNQVPDRNSITVPTITNYIQTRKFVPSSSKNESTKQRGNKNPDPGTSKFTTPHSTQPSMDKAGNPIYFKCGKIGFA